MINERLVVEIRFAEHVFISVERQLEKSISCILNLNDEDLYKFALFLK